MRTTEPAAALPSSFAANCLDTDLVGHAVRITGAKVGDLYQVTRVDIDATAATEARAVGVITSKSDTTTCVVQTSGILSDVATGLTSGSLLFVATDATLSSTPPSRPGSGKRMIQALAYALSSDVAVLAPSLRVRILAS